MRTLTGDCFYCIYIPSKQKCNDAKPLHTTLIGVSFQRSVQMKKLLNLLGGFLVELIGAGCI